MWVFTTRKCETNFMQLKTQCYTISSAPMLSQHAKPSQPSALPQSQHSIATTKQESVSYITKLSIQLLMNWKLNCSAGCYISTTLSEEHLVSCTNETTKITND